MAMLNFLALLMLLFLVRGANAQQLSVTSVVVASIFATIGGILAIGIIAYIVYRFCCRKKEPKQPLKGFDNPVSTMAYGSTDDVAEELKEVVVPDGSTQKAATNGSHSPEDRTATQDASVLEDGEPKGEKQVETPLETPLIVADESQNEKPESHNNDDSSSNSSSSSSEMSVDEVTELEVPKVNQEETASKSSDHGDGKSSDGGSYHQVEVADQTIEQPEQSHFGGDEEDRKRSGSTSSSSSFESEKLLDVIEEAKLAQVGDERRSSSSSSGSDNVVVEEKVPSPVVEEVVLVQSSSADLETAPEIETPKAKPDKARDDIVFVSGWRRAVRLLDLAKARLVSEDTMKKLEFGEIEESEVAKDLQQYLSGEEPIAGLVFEDSGEKMSLYDATKQKIIRRGTAVSLLEAQAATGSIINPYNGSKMTVEEATREGLIDRQFEAVLVRAERAVLGYKTRLSPEPLSLFDAMKRNLVVESHGIRLLEAQIATGGIIDPKANHRLPVDVAFERGLFDKRLHDILEDPSDDTKGFFDPNTNENLTYLELMKRCIFDKDTSLRLLPFVQKKAK